MSVYDEALLFATEKHKGQYRKGGLPYITHPVAVAQKLIADGYPEEYAVTGLFHDLLEDTDASEEEILRIGGEKVLFAVKLLTKFKGYDMDEYVSSIKANPMAMAVKAADRLHNLECAVVCSEEFKRRYILETVDYYMDFDKRIPIATKNLAKSMSIPLSELGYYYELVETHELFTGEDSDPS